MTSPFTIRKPCPFPAAILLNGSGAQDRDSLNTYVSGQSYVGITKTLKFDAQGEVSDVAIYASTVKDGKIVSVGLIQ